MFITNSEQGGRQPNAQFPKCPRGSKGRGLWASGWFLVCVAFLSTVSDSVLQLSQACGADGLLVSLIKACEFRKKHLGEGLTPGRQL